MEHASQDSPTEISSNTHIHQIMEEVARSPYKVAPEKNRQLHEILKKHNSELRVSDGAEVTFRFEVMYGQVFTSIRSLQHIWVSACLFAALYCERQKAESRGETSIPITGNEDIEKIRVFYDMSRKAFKECKPLPWPVAISEVTPNAEYLILADEIYRLMCSFAILHEIGHTEGKHTKLEEAKPNEETQDRDLLQEQINNELEADKWAFDWILSTWRDYGNDSRIFVKRTLGIIFTMIMSDEFRNLSEDKSYSTHPPSVERLINFFNDYESEIESNEWKSTIFSAISLGLMLHSLNNGTPLPTNDPYNGIRDLLDKVKARQDSLSDQDQAESKS